MSTGRTVKACWRKVLRSEAGEHHADAYRLRSCWILIWRSRSSVRKGCSNTKSKAVGPERWHFYVSGGGAHPSRNRVPPAAAHDACVVKFLNAGLDGATVGGSLTVTIMVAVLDPLPNVAAHVIEIEAIREEAPNRTGVGVLIIATIATHKAGDGGSLSLGGDIGRIRVTALVRFAVTPIPSGGRASACSIFPLGLAQ